MINDKGILIKNVYYMLSYAFQVLRQKKYEEIASEDFENIQDLFAAIIYKGISQQLKQGLYREYVEIHENRAIMRGKLDINGTIRERIQRKRTLACEYDELSVNNIYNQIIHTTIDLLAKSPNVKAEIRAELKKVLLYFHEIDVIEPGAIPWSVMSYHRNNKNYEMLLNICYFVLDGMLLTTEAGKYKMNAFSDEHMSRLYEKFVLEYYKKHHSYLDEVKSAQIKWNITAGTEENMIKFLPAMQSDIFLRAGNKVLIIDTKYYGKAFQYNYDKATLHSGNVYQIFTYVKNADTEGTGNVAGLLLYAKTEEEITPDCSFMLGGNRIGAKTLDLNQTFANIAYKLDRIVEEFLIESND